MYKEIKPKKCRACGEIFTPQRPLQQACGFGCALKIQQIKKEKVARKITSEAREGMLTHKDWLNMLQVVFNTYIRCRDKHLPCITCGTNKGQMQSGHYYSVSSSPSLRFNEDNAHAQCVHCNCHLHGNLIAYGEQLPLRIGAERFEALKQARNNELKLSIPEIKQQISDYKLKIKQA